MTKQGGWPASGFGQRLKELREARGLTGQQLAEAAGCHMMTISKLERGTQEPAWPLVLALCKALGVSCEAFTQEAEDRPAVGPGRPRKTVGTAQGQVAEASEKSKEPPKGKKRKEAQE